MRYGRQHLSPNLYRLRKQILKLARAEEVDKECAQEHQATVFTAN